MKVMIVDDEPSNLELFAEIFEDDENVITKCYKSGNLALDDYEEFKPDVIILDIMMPGKDGFEVCKTIKSNVDGQKTKIIMVTGMSGSQVENKAFDSGCNKFFLKPVSIEALREEVLK